MSHRAVEGKVASYLSVESANGISGKAVKKLVEPRGFEPLTSSLRTRRSTN